MIDPLVVKDSFLKGRQSSHKRWQQDPPVWVTMSPPKRAKPSPPRSREGSLTSSTPRPSACATPSSPPSRTGARNERHRARNERDRKRPVVFGSFAEMELPELAKDLLGKQIMVSMVHIQGTLVRLAQRAAKGRTHFLPRSL